MVKFHSKVSWQSFMAKFHGKVSWYAPKTFNIAWKLQPKVQMWSREYEEKTFGFLLWPSFLSSFRAKALFLCRKETQQQELAKNWLLKRQRWRQQRHQHQHQLQQQQQQARQNGRRWEEFFYRFIKGWPWAKVAPKRPNLKVRSIFLSFDSYSFLFGHRSSWALAIILFRVKFTLIWKFDLIFQSNF